MSLHCTFRTVLNRSHTKFSVVFSKINKLKNNVLLKVMLFYMRKIQPIFFSFLGIFRNYLFLKHLTKLYTNDRLYDWNNAILSKRKIKNSKKDKTQWRREKKNKTKKSMKNSKSSVKWGGLIRKSHAESNMQESNSAEIFG